MPVFEVDLFEGKELVTYRVEADSPEAAEEQAIQRREEVFQQENSREALEAEREQIQEKLGKTGLWEGAVKPGLQQSGANIASGLGDATLAIAQGATDLAALGGVPGAEQASEALQGQRNSIRDFNRNVTVKAYEKTAGRPLTEAEQAKAIEDADNDQRLAKMAGEIGLTAGLGGVALRASTVPRMLAVGTTEGALSGWLLGGESDDIKNRQAERGLSSAFGTVVGLGGSLIPGAFAGAKNWLVRRVNRAAGGDALAKRAALEDAGISAPVTVGQLTGSPTILAAEAQASGSVADSLFRQQQQQVAGNLARKIGVQIPPMSEMTTGTRAIVREGIKRTGETLGKLRGERNKAFEQGIKALEDMTGSTPVIRFDGVAEPINDILAGVHANYRNVPYSKNFTTLINDLNDAIANGATPTRANSILLRLNQMKKSGSGIFNEKDEVVAGSLEMYKGHAQKIANTMKKHVEAAFDKSADSLGGEAGSLLKGLRARYGAQSEQIGVLEDELMGALGMKGDVADILRRLGNADDAAVRSAMEGLKKLPGGEDFHQKLLAGVYRQAVNDGSQAAVGSAAKAGDFNLRVFVESLTKNAEQSKLKGFLTPRQEANMMEGVKAVRTLLNDPRQASRQGVIKTFLPVDLQGIAINALSRDPGFMARLVAQGIQRGKGAEQLFFTKEGIDLLTGATKSVVVGKGSGQIAGTIIAMFASMLGAANVEEMVNEALQQQE
jgi:hypothetical protein